MQQEFMDSVKARLYDFKYTPFLSSYIFAWLYWNSKSILIFTSNKLTIEDKITMLSYGNINYEYPLYFALFYVFIFPLASAVFYAVTLGYRLLMNKIQQLIQDKTPLPQEEANKIINANAILQEQLNEKNIVLSKMKSDNEQSIANIKSEYEKKEKSLETQISQQVSQRTKQIEEDIEIEKNEVEACMRRFSIEQQKNIDFEKENNILKKKIKELEPKNTNQTKLGTVLNDETDNLILKLSDNQKNILFIFNENDTMLQRSVIKDNMKSSNKVNKPETEHEINEMKDELNILDNGGVSDYLKLTDIGLKVVNRLFNHK